MGRQKSRKTHFKLDDYNQPTEPLERIVLPPSASSPTYTVGDWSPGTLPAPQADIRPVPQEAPPAYPYYQLPQTGGYPVLPPPPYKKYRGSPPGGSKTASQPARRKSFRRSPIPGLVGVFFVLVQLVLLVRIGCILFSVQSTALWFTVLLATSNLFVEPVRWLGANIHLSWLAGTSLLTDLEFLLAILAYGLFSRLFVRLLRALLNR